VAPVYQVQYKRFQDSVVGYYFALKALYIIMPSAMASITAICDSVHHCDGVHHCDSYVSCTTSLEFSLFTPIITVW